MCRSRTTNENPEDSLVEYIRGCIEGESRQPAELKIAMKELFKFLKWKVPLYPSNFTEEDLRIIANQEINNYFKLSPKSCSYTKNCIKQYTELIWFNKLRNQLLVEGEPHIPRPSCNRLPVPITTPREEEVQLMSIMYPQNLLNSFVYRHTYKVESPLCPRCHRHEQTPFHVIYECNNHSAEIQQLIGEILGDEEAQHADCTTLLNCSRNRRFIEICLKIISEVGGEFRVSIDLS